MSEPYELNRRIRQAQAELDDIDRLGPDRMPELRRVVAERLDSLLSQHRTRTGRSILQESEAAKREPRKATHRG